MSRRRKSPNDKAPKIASDLGRAVVQLRGEMEMSRETLAELADTHPGSLGAIERGESSPSIETVGLIAAGLGISPSELLKLAGH